MPIQLDAHARPPETLRALFKKLQKCTPADLKSSHDILDFTEPETLVSVGDHGSRNIPESVARQAFSRFLKDERAIDLSSSFQVTQIYHVNTLPGLYIYPSLLPVEIQTELLNQLLHRDLSNESHKTNLHLHYDIPYPSHHLATESGSLNASFFQNDLQALLKPKDPSVHKSISIRQMLERKLRWLTLGGQYDWTAKVYPSEQPPDFPADICDLIRSLWPDVDAQAAIVNFYTPGDTLSVHRDVSEECDRGLVSISIGCDAIFLIGDADGGNHVTLRLRSGDALLMSGEARFAWHAVPKIVAGTCPTELQNWPALSSGSDYEEWRGWLGNKRINLNVRQMRAG